MRILALLALTASALAQAPVSNILLDQDSLPALGAKITWSAVSGATYNVYRAQTYNWKDCSNSLPGWKKIASGLTTLRYEDYPTADQYGYGGQFCYGVTSVVNAAESPIATGLLPVQMGLKFYIMWAYWSQDCDTWIGQPTGSGMLTVQLTHADGAVVDVPFVFVNGNSVESPPRWVGSFRALSSDKVIAILTLPDSKTFTFPMPFGGSSDGTPLRSNWNGYFRVGLDPNDGFCNKYEWANFQAASDNP
jgi:hypothetical protein